MEHIDELISAGLRAIDLRNSLQEAIALDPFIPVTAVRADRAQG